MDRGKHHAGDGVDRRSSGTDRKKPYRRPELIEYGSVAKLTQSNGSKGQDAIIGTKSMNCL
jgi:hypothetical protein